MSCAWITQYGRQCANAAPETAVFPGNGRDGVLILCGAHRRMAMQWFVPTPVPPLNDEAWYVYFILNRAADQIKIGHSVQPETRIKNLETEAGLSYETLLIIPETDELTEGLAHFEARRLRIKGEWFDSTPELWSWIGEIEQWTIAWKSIDYEASCAASKEQELFFNVITNA